MITVMAGLNFPLAGDGTSTSVDLDLDNFPTGVVPLPPTAEIVGFGTITVNGPSPAPTATAEVKSGSKHIITLTFSSPLNEFVGNNAYGIVILALLAPQ